jgi:hypothetical protein
MYGMYLGNVNSPSVTDGVVMDGAGNLPFVTPPCNAPFTAYTRGTMDVSSSWASVTAVS